MDTTPLDPTHLIALVAVAEELSFSKAATRLGVTKGTISRKIARLEDRVGAALLWRSTHVVSLTANGRELYERARGPVRALNDVAQEQPLADAPFTGSIRLAAAHDVASTLLPQVLEGFMIAHPLVSFDVNVGAEPVNLVRSGIDLALRVAVKQMKRSALVARKLCELPIGLFAAPAYIERRGQPRAFGDASHTWLSFMPRGLPPAEIDRSERTYLGAPNGFRPHRSDDFSLLRELARRGLGVAGMPAFFAEPLVRVGALCPVLTRVRAPFSATLYLVSPPRRKTSARVLAFHNHVVALLGTRR